MKTIRFYLYICFCMLLLTSSCQRFADEVIESSPVTLKVQTRAVGDLTIQYPVNLFAFTNEGTFVSEHVIQSANEDISFQLPAGTYRLVALSGLNDDYEIGEKPRLNDMISFSNGQFAENPLMHGMADVSLSEKNAKVTITMTYVVAAINVSMGNITGATSVSVSISPLYPNLCLDGSYTGEGKRINLVCHLTEDGTWASNTCYVFPGIPEKTVFSVTIEKGEDTQTYGYTYKGIPQANHPFNVIGNYNGSLSISGALLAKGWDEAIDVDFSFGGKSDSTEDPGETDPYSEYPVAGSIWNDCIVVSSSNETSSGADLLLLSLEEWEGKYSEGEQVIDGYAVNDIGDWRLPTDTEAKLIRDTFNGESLAQLNELIAGRSYDEVEISSTARYLCKKGSLYYSFQFAEGKRITQAGSSTTYYIRPVKSYRYNK